MAYNDRAADHKIVKMTKHFIGVSDSDADSFGTDSHNPGNIVVNFLNPNITNVSSSSDATKTILNPISLQFDITYNNVSESFRNNRFRLRSMSGNALQQGLGQNGVRENGSNPAAQATYNPKTFPVIKIPDNIYKTGADLGAAVLKALNDAEISCFGGNQIAFTGTIYDGGSQSIRFRHVTDAPNASQPILFIDSVFTDPNTNIQYDSSRVLGTTGADVGAPNFVQYTDGAMLLAYAAFRNAGVTTPAFSDIQTVDLIQLRSNVAKRYYRKQGNNLTAGLNPLSFVPILFEIPMDTVVGGSFYWTPHDDRFSQEISSDFSTMTLSITDKFGNVIPFNNNAEMNFQFSIERNIIVPSNEDRIKAMSEYNRFKSF
jgi:hypothetical protein